MRLARLLAATFVVLTAVVAAGGLRSVDRYAIHHLAPFSGGAAAWPIVPADAVPALLLAAGGALVYRRRGTPWRAGGVWVVAVVAGLAVEAVGKLLVPQIAYTFPATVFGVTFDGTYPSGHTTRSVILTAMVVSLWPRVLPLAVAWVLYVTAVLELCGMHVPSDIAGGYLLGGALAAAASARSRAAIRAGSPLAALQSARRALAQAPRPADLQASPRVAEAGGRRPGADRRPEQPEAG